MTLLGRFTLAAASFLVAASQVHGDADVYLLDVPDYQWHAGCFGTATGNLMGYWDRHGLRDFYTGPAGGGTAPLDDYGANVAIRLMWASVAHMNDYYVAYESTAQDPYVTAGRAEHEPDCIGDFIGLSQKKWVSMAGECDGNIDAYSFAYWNLKGDRRVNYVPSADAGTPARDIQSGLSEWAKWRGYDADVFTQLVDFNPHTPLGKGFTYQDLKAEINAGYPVMVFLQNYNETYRSFAGMPRANPGIHGVLIYGYQEYPEFGAQLVYIKTSWGLGPTFQGWTATQWLNTGLSVRGVIGFRPKPRVRSIIRASDEITLEWDGPSSQIYDALAQTTTPVHRYQVERATSLTAKDWSPVGSATTDLSSTFEDCCHSSAFYRVRLLGPLE